MNKIQSAILGQFLLLFPVYAVMQITVSTMGPSFFIPGETPSANLGSSVVAIYNGLIDADLLGGPHADGVDAKGSLGQSIDRLEPKPSAPVDRDAAILLIGVGFIGLAGIGRKVTETICQYVNDASECRS